MCNITLAQLDSLANLGSVRGIGLLLGQNGVQAETLGESVARIVHDAFEIIFESQRVDLLVGELVEVVLLTLQMDNIMI